MVTLYKYFTTLGHDVQCHDTLRFILYYCTRWLLDMLEMAYLQNTLMMNVVQQQKILLSKKGQKRFVMIHNITQGKSNYNVSFSSFWLSKESFVRYFKKARKMLKFIYTMWYLCFLWPNIVHFIHCAPKILKMAKKLQVRICLLSIL